MFKKSRRRSRHRISTRSTGSNNSSSTTGTSLRGILKLPPSSILVRGAAAATAGDLSIGGSSAGSRSTITTRAAGDGPRRVSFANVTVREFERTLGDNPSCSSGAPISIGWKYLADQTQKLDEYEKERPPRRDQPDLVLSRQEREELLVEWGASFQDIIDSIRSGIKAKNQRRSTVNAIGRYDRWEEMMESARGRLKKAVGLQRSNQYVAMVPPPTHRPDRSPRVPHSHRHTHTHAHAPETRPSEPEPKEDDGVPKMPVRRMSHDFTHGNNDVEKAVQELLNSSDMKAIVAEYGDDERRGGGDGDNAQPPPSLVESSALSEMSQQNETKDSSDPRGLTAQESLLSYDSKRPTDLIEVDVAAESCDTSLRSSLRSLQSGLTVSEEQMESYWDDGESCSTDSFRGLVRDTSHWMVGGMDAPRVLRCYNPTVINEDGMHDNMIPPVMANWQYQGFGMQPPPYSNTIINRWT